MKLMIIINNYAYKALPRTSILGSNIRVRFVHSIHSPQPVSLAKAGCTIRDIVHHMVMPFGEIYPSPRVRHPAGRWAVTLIISIIPPSSSFPRRPLSPSYLTQAPPHQRCFPAWTGIALKFLCERCFICTRNLDHPISIKNANQWPKVELPKKQHPCFGYTTSSHGLLSSEGVSPELGLLPRVWSPDPFLCSKNDTFLVQNSGATESILTAQFSRRLPDTNEKSAPFPFG